MHFAFADAMCDPAHYAPLAQAADALGYRTFAIGDSICCPDEADGEYPYLDSGNRGFLEGAPFIDPFQLASALATVTARLRFRTGVLKLPIREPVLVAKQVASLAVSSGNRSEPGVGLSPWIEAFKVTTELAFGPRNPYVFDTMTVEQKVRAAERFAEDIIAKV